MATLIHNIAFPELFFGLVAPIGVDLQACIPQLKASLHAHGYTPVEIKVTDIFRPLGKYVIPDQPLKTSPEAERYRSYIKFGNKLRAIFEDDAALAVLTIARLVRARLREARKRRHSAAHYEKIAYIIHQFKRKEEIDLLRSLYGKQFYQISVYSRRGARVDFLSQRFANTENSPNKNAFRSDAEEIVQIDYDEASDDHGQKVVKIFHDGDFIINLDKDSASVLSQTKRFIDLLFGSNRISPTRMEYQMFIAKAAALRTLDLSRQVGAAIFSPEGDIISMGSNEVPKAGGGTYWCDDEFDDREYVRGVDSNDRRKKEILSELFGLMGKNNGVDNAKVKNSQFMDALEYGRIIHAEMSAIVDAARTGRSTKNAQLFCTTFPCHMCAKHIVGAGIDKVYFLEPYPKSLVSDLHNDSIAVEGNERGHYAAYPSVVFEHFYGVSPRRYRELFERGSRKEDGKFNPWKHGEPRPNIAVTSPEYASFEVTIMQTVIPRYAEKVKFDSNIFNK